MFDEEKIVNAAMIHLDQLRLCDVVISDKNLHAFVRLQMFRNQNNPPDEKRVARVAKKARKKHSEKSRKYRPSSAMEGACFEASFCERCDKDRLWRTRQAKPCKIRTLVQFLDTSDPGYPDEWAYVDGTPACLAFISEDDAKKAMKEAEDFQAGQIKLF